MMATYTAKARYEYRVDGELEPRVFESEVTRYKYTPAGHNIDPTPAAVRWAADYSSLSVDFYCTREGCENYKDTENPLTFTTDEVTTTVVNPGDCEHGKITRYSANITVNGSVYPFTRTVTDVAEGHQWQEDSRIEPNCDTAGVIYESCTVCGETKETPLPPNGHEYTATKEDVNFGDDYDTATVTIRCSVCGAVETKEAKVEKKITQHQACEKPEITTLTVTVEIEGSDPVVIEYESTETKPALQHKWRQTSHTPASCTVDEVTEYQCDLCQQTKKETGERATGHTPVEERTWRVTVPATCTDAATEESTCDKCGQDKQTRTSSDHPALGHTPLGQREWKVTQPATCTTAAIEESTCKTCGQDKQTRESPTQKATGHSWGPWEDETPATCTDKGRQKQTCNNCQEVQYQDVQAKGHSWNGNHTCNTCGILNIAEAEAAIDDYARNLDREPKITIDQAAVSNGAYFVMTPVYSADYNRIVNNGHTAVDEIIAQANGLSVKSVKAVIEFSDNSYTVKVYYIYNQGW